MDDWQPIETAPKNEPVLVCPINCEIVVGIQREIDVYENNSTKPHKGWRWLMYKNERLNNYFVQMKNIKMWMPIPSPPKHLWERKLAADMLEKQIAELRK